MSELFVNGRFFFWKKTKSFMYRNLSRQSLYAKNHGVLIHIWVIPIKMFKFIENEENTTTYDCTILPTFTQNYTAKYIHFSDIYQNWMWPKQKVFRVVIFLRYFFWKFENFHENEYTSLGANLIRELPFSSL